MVVDPSKISLKGLFLDPAPDTVSETTGQPGNTVGGTRHIFSNGVMAAKIYLGFSYSASSGDSSTVQDIVDWLAANAEMRLAGDNNTDMGPLPDKGWQ
ncbi:hypothetical protein HAX39_25360, partial [Citrobacter freundii]|nr:hypothetical protein [Citrobacter freundii]